MADESQIAELRQLINEPDDVNGWTDERVGAIIDATDTMNTAASKAWALKAGEYSALVDVSESGSSRKLGDLMKNAQSMAAHYAAQDAPTEAASSGPVIHRIRRGFS